jgi:ComF family protein
VLFSRPSSTLGSRIGAPFTWGLKALRPPGLCAVCRSWGVQRVCAECLARWAAPAHRCARCALAVPPGTSVCGACLIHPPPYTHAVAAFDYAFPWDGLIARFKFNAALDLATLLAQQLADAVQRAKIPAPALLLPVPLSEARLRERGYNQAWELARRLAARLDCPADARLLLRVKDTPHQTALPPDERAANVQGAFSVEPLRATELRGRDVALVDDVMTTGATLAELARGVLAAGAASVQVWVIARTPRPDR